MNNRRLPSILIALSIAESVSAQHLVRTNNSNVRIVDVAHSAAMAQEAFSWTVPAWLTAQGSQSRITEIPQFAAIVRQGQAMPTGQTGTLSPNAYFNPATVDSRGRIAFSAQVDGAERNQGIFFADATHLKVIAMGCGQGGGSGSTSGCGDPTPIGGTFSGVFIGTTPSPAANDKGDVLFMADVAGGSAPRGLFLYRAANADIVKIAAVGDVSPRGGTLTAIGPGSINNNGMIVFLASTGGNGAQGSDVLLWHGGVVTKYVAAGDPAPGGESFVYIGTEANGYADGTWIPIGSVPAINDSDQIAFSGFTPSMRGHLLSHDGTHAWQVRVGDPAPGGGKYFDLEGAPVLNGHGDIAFNAYIADSVAGPVTGGGWFAGSPGKFRRALAFNDPVADGIAYGLAFSRNPFRPLDDAGNLALWTSRRLADTTERGTLLVARADGTLDILASEGDASPLGGSWGSMDAWPTANSAHQVRFGAATPGYPGSTDAMFVATHFVDVLFRDGFDNPE